MTHRQQPARRRSLAQVWSHPEYRSVLLVMVLSGVSVSSYVPLISLFLVQTLEVDDSSVGLFTLTFLAAPLVGIAAGKLSDRLRSRIPMMVAVAIWVALGRLAMGVAPSFTAAIVVGIVFGALAGVLNAQAFAILKDILDCNQEPRQATIGSTVRAGYSLGWVIGPLLGTLLAAALGYRAALATTGLVVLVALLPLRGLRTIPGGPSRDDQPPTTRGSPGPTSHPTGRAGWQGSWGSPSLWVFALVCLLALTGEAIRLSYLPVLAVDRLDISLGSFGLLMSVAPLLELAVMPIAGVLADHLGLKTVILGGLVVGAAGFWVFASSNGIIGLLAGQLLNACFIAVLLGLGVTYAQHLHPRGAGFAGSVFFASQSLSVVTAGIIGSAVANRLGLPALFLASALLCVSAALLLLFTRGSNNHRAQDVGPG